MLKTVAVDQSRLTVEALTSKGFTVEQADTLFKMTLFDVLSKLTIADIMEIANAVP